MKELESKAKSAFKEWSNSPIVKRAELLLAFSQKLEKSKEEMAQLISTEIGKPLWEARTEVDSAIAKGSYTIDAFKARCPENVRQLTQGRSITRHKPHGVVAVLGPFNFPLHLPHGHIAPALLAGNAVLFKPSEHGSSVAEFYRKIWEEVGLPKSVLQVVHGDARIGAKLVDLDIGAVFFTGSLHGGLSLLEKFAARPDILLALEMGGNNPLVVTEVNDLLAASYMTVLSAYLTSGQRCSSARRLIVPNGSRGDAFIRELTQLISSIKVGLPTDKPEPFMGPLVSEKAATLVFDTYQALLNRGGKAVVPMERLDSRLLTASLVDVTEIAIRPDEECFGPLLQLIRVKNFEAAISEANNTKYGLTAALFSQNSQEYEHFFHEVKAGIINWNAPTTGASSLAPFGGVGMSGNFRPSGFYSTDYVAYPVASVENNAIQMAASPLPGIYGVKR